MSLKMIEKNENTTNTNIKIYTKRWYILAMLCICGISNTLQVMQYTIIADVVVEYYNVSLTAVDWSSMIFAITFVVISFPGGYILDKLGTRKAVLIGAVGNSLGTWIKVFSVHPDRYWVVMLGQGVVSIFQIGILPLAPKVAAAWFGADEISMAGTLGWFGIMLGNSFGYIIPPFVISRGDIKDIERGFFIINLSYASLTAAVIPLLFFFFPERPPIPPSVAQARALEGKISSPTPFKKSAKSLFTNRSYMLYLIITAINIGVFAPFQILTNQIILIYYPDATRHAGIIGLLSSFLNIIGSFIVSFFLDKFKKYKEITLSTHALYFLALVLCVSTLDQGLPVLYFTIILIGLLLGAITSLGIQVILELTYPEPENITTGLSINFTSLLVVVFTSLYSYIYQSASIMWANITICLITLVTNMFLFLVKFDLRRQNIEKKSSASAKLELSNQNNNN